MENYTENCGNCSLWRSLPNDKSVGECRRHPPVFRENTIIGEWPVTKDKAWCGEWKGALQGMGSGDRPVVPSGVEVDVAQLGRPTSESMVVNRKAYNQLRSRVSELEECCKRYSEVEARLRAEVRDLKTKPDIKEKPAEKKPARARKAK